MKQHIQDWLSFELQLKIGDVCYKCMGGFSGLFKKGSPQTSVSSHKVYSVCLVGNTSEINDCVLMIIDSI